MLEFIVRGQLKKRSPKETPCEETFFGSTDPRLKENEILDSVLNTASVILAPGGFITHGYLCVVNKGGPVLVIEPILEGQKGEESEDLCCKNDESDNGKCPEYINHFSIGAQAWNYLSSNHYHPMAAVIPLLRQMKTIIQMTTRLKAT